MAVTGERWWTAQQGPGPVVATAIHDGHELGAEAASAVALSDSERLREEDPFTGEAILDVPTHIVAHRSRFEFDLNRAPNEAVYRTPEQSWGLQVWKQEPAEELVERSLAMHSAYYRMLEQFLDSIALRHRRFVVLDVHSYNHRRGGSKSEPTPLDKAPDINIGTYSMPRDHWAFLIDPLIEWLSGFNFNGRKLKVGENVAFQGKGYQARFVHERYPLRGCAIAFEFKKFFMDEWSGVPDPAELAEMRRLVGLMASKCAELVR